MSRAPLIAVAAYASLKWRQRTGSGALCDRGHPAATHVCIAGYGAAGRAAAEHLLRHKHVRVTVVDSAPDKLPAPSANDSGSATGASYIRGEVTSIQAQDKRVVLSDGTEIAFDKCIVALGRARPSEEFYSNYVDAEARNVYHYKDLGALESIADVLRGGGHVTVIGNDCRAVQLVARIAAMAQPLGYANNVSLVFSDFLMTAQIPKYLSAAIQRRLRARWGIEMLPLTQVQYVGSERVIPRGLPGADKASIAVYASSTYDLMGSAILGTNAVLIVRDELALASVATDLERDSTGAAVVNQSLAATASVWAVGDSANLSTRGGRGAFSGDQHCRSTASVAADNVLGGERVYADVPHLELCLPEAGVDLALVGSCSTALATYGFWWRQPVRRKPAAAASAESKPFSPLSALTGGLTGGLRLPPVAEARSQRAKVVLGVARTARSSGAATRADQSAPDPVYGMGLVFYLNGDSVCGVLLGGVARRLPRERRDRLIDRLKALIGRKLDIQVLEFGVGEQVLRYRALADIVDELTREEGFVSSELNGPQFVLTQPSTRVYQRGGFGLIGVVGGVDSSFTLSSSKTISSAEKASNAFRKGANPRGAVDRR